MIDHDRAARRYFQIRALEETLSACEKIITVVEGEISEAQGRLSDLRATKRGLTSDIREAARDEGKLPLLDMMADVDTVGATKQ